MRDRDMTPAEQLAHAGLRGGVLEPLADLLAEENGDLHWLLARELVKVIRGDASQTDHRLKFIRHPDLKAGQGFAARHKAFTSEMDIAIEMDAAGAFERGGHESAVQHCMTKFGLSRSTVQKAWSNRKATIKFYRAHGMNIGSRSKSEQ